jgi:hypothetical protein
MKALLTTTLLLICTTVYCQIEAVHFNAGWNEANGVEWFSKIKDCDTKSLLIEDDNNQSKYEIAIVPTIIIFDDGEEVKRFQADLSFKMVATKEEVKEYIEELIISKF